MIKIVTDTTSCLPERISAQYGIPVIPQVINFGNESYLEGVEIDIHTFMDKLKTYPELPKTAAPPPELFVDVFRSLDPYKNSILCIHPSAEVSGTVRSATIAAQEFPGADIRIIDTRLIASPLAELVKIAVSWSRDGQTPNWIEQKIIQLAASGRIYFLVATLEYLAKGGRIGGAQALLGSLLQVKPILTVVDGKVESLEKARTFKQALNRLITLTTSEYPSAKNGYLTVLHAGVPEQGNELANDLKAKLELSEVLVYDMPPAIVAHAGPGVLGVGFFTNPENI